MKKDFLDISREGIWPWWALVFSSVVFTFACPGLMIARKLYIAHRKKWAFLLSFFSLSIFSLYFFSSFYWRLFWQTAFLVHVLVSIIIGFLWVFFQAFLNVKLFDGKASSKIWPREQERPKENKSFSNIASAAIIIFVATLLASSLVWLPPPPRILKHGGRFLFEMIGIIALLYLPFILIVCCMWQRKYGQIPTRVLICYVLGIFGLVACSAFMTTFFNMIASKVPLMGNVYAFGDIELSNNYRGLLKWIRILITVPLVLYISDSRTVKMLFLRGFCVIGLIFLLNIQAETWASTHVHYLFSRGSRNINSLDVQERKRGVSQLERFSKVFPNSSIRSDLSLGLSQYYLQHGQKQKARQVLSNLIAGDKDNPVDFQDLRKVRSILSRIDSSQPAEPEFIDDVPIIRPTESLTPNWQSLLTMLKFWKKDMLAEEFKSELAKISTSEDRINLLEIEYLIEFREFARRLGYQAFFRFGNLDDLKMSLEKKIPVLVKIGGSYRPIIGYDSCTKQFAIFAYHEESEEKSWITRERVKESISLDRAFIVESERREYKENFKEFISWREEDSFKSAWQLNGNIMAFFFPEEEAEDYLKKLGFDVEQTKLQTKAISLFFLASLYYDKDDRNNAIRLFWKAQQLMPECRQFSQSIHICRMALEKVSSDPRVRDLGLDFDRKLYQEWKKDIKAEDLELCKVVFEEDYQNNRLYTDVLARYSNLWDEDFPEERPYLIYALTHLIECYGSSVGYYHNDRLAQIYERNKDYRASVRVRQAMSLTNLADFDNLMELAKGYSQLGDFERSWHEWGKVGYYRKVWQPEYYYVISQRFSEKGFFWLADQSIDLSLALDRTQPKYHLAKAKILIKMNRPQDARKVLQWVLQIYTEDEERETAEMLMNKL